MTSKQTLRGPIPRPPRAPYKEVVVPAALANLPRGLSTPSPSSEAYFSSRPCCAFPFPTCKYQFPADAPVVRGDPFSDSERPGERGGGDSDGLPAEQASPHVSEAEATALREELGQIASALAQDAQVTERQRWERKCKRVLWAVVFAATVGLCLLKYLLTVTFS